MVMIGTSSEETVELINENDEYKVVRLPIRKFYLGESKEFIWQPSLLRVTRKIEVVNTRTNKVYPVGSIFYLDTDCTPKFSVQQVTSGEYALRYTNSGKSASLKISYGNMGDSYERKTGVIRANCSPYGYQANAYNNNPHGMYDKRIGVYMGRSAYWDSEENAKKMLYCKQVCCGGYMYTWHERNSAGSRGYYTRNSDSENSVYHSYGSNNGTNTRTLANKGLPLIALDWQRLSYFSFRSYWGSGADWNVNGGLICWFTNYYEEEDFYKMGIRCY